MSARGQRDRRERRDGATEVDAARHEVGLAVHLDDGAALTARRNRHQPLERDTIGLLRGHRRLRVAQPLDGGVQVAAGLGERRAAGP
jgi:hypothetical protein